MNKEQVQELLYELDVVICRCLNETKGLSYIEVKKLFYPYGWSNLKEYIETLETDNKYYEKQIEDYQDEVNEVENELSALKTKVQDIADDMDKAHEDVKYDKIGELITKLMKI